MTKQESFRIGMALHKVVMSVDDDTLERISPYLKEVENIVLAQKLDDEKESE